MAKRITTVVTKEIHDWRKMTGVKWSEMLRMGYGLMRRRPELIEQDRKELEQKIEKMADRLSRLSQENWTLKDRMAKIEQQGDSNAQKTL